jgi:hypothetical protein
MDVPTWYGMTVTGKLQPTLAGWWLGCVSLPLVQFILLRWYFRLLIWTRFLWQVSRIDLRLVAIHPDRRRRLGLSFHRHLCLRSLAGGPGGAARRANHLEFLTRIATTESVSLCTPMKC